MFWKKAKAAKGLLLYSCIQDIIGTQSVLQREGLAVSLVPPPAELAVGCDLAVQFNPLEEELLRSMMNKGLILPGRIEFVDRPMKAIENLTTVTEICPGFLMAVSNNIKLTVDLANHEIVNLSGGGCPDIPYVAHELIGCRLDQCPEPVDTGTSLCTYMVQLALDRLRLEVKPC